MRKILIPLIGLSVLGMAGTVYASEYADYVWGQTVIEIPSGCDTRDFFESEFSLLASEAEENVIASVEDGAYMGMTYNADGDTIRGWCYCPEELIDDIYWLNFDKELQIADSYVYVSNEYSVADQVFVNPFSEPECAYVTLKVCAIMPDEYKEWMTYTLVVQDTERNFCWSYELCDMFEGVKSFDVLLPVGSYHAVLFADGVEYEHNFPAEFTVSTDYVAKGTLYLYGPTVNEGEVISIETEMGETYDWLELSDDTEVEEETEEEFHVNVSSKDDAEESEEEESSESTSADTLNESAESTVEVTDSDDEESPDDTGSGIFNNLKPVRVFNLICVAILGLVLYYYFYYRPRKIRKKRAQERR